MRTIAPVTLALAVALAPVGAARATPGRRVRGEAYVRVDSRAPSGNDVRFVTTLPPRPWETLRRVDLPAPTVTRALRLPDGSVMVNQGCQSRTGCDLSNELLDARATSFAAMEPALTIRAFHETLVHSPARTVISIGGCQPRTCSWWNETYDISNIRPLVDAGMTTDASADVPAVRDVSEVDRAVTTDVTADGSGDAGATLEDVGGAVDAASGQDVPRGEPPPGGCACEVTSLATQRPEPWVVFFVFGLIAMRRGAYSRRRGS
jgi:hypothetical protein